LNEIQPNKRRASLDNRSSNGLVAVEDIEAMAKRRKMDKEARLASIKSGRCKGSLDINHYKKPHTNPNSSTNNKQKSKNKSFIMVKQKKDIRKKNKRSFRDKQNALRNSLLRKRKK
jgi:protein SDA1